MKNQRHQLLCFALCTLSLISLASCEKNKKPEQESKEILEILKKTEPEFDTESQVIYFKECMKYDIKGDIGVSFNPNIPNNFDLGCQFSFFNYGENIRLFNGCIDDSFITGIGTINLICVLKYKDIHFTHRENSKKYGDWALVTLSFGISDAFMTPLAMKAYKESEDDCYIFIQFIAKDKYMNVLFYGGPNECFVVSKFPNYIIQQSYGSRVNDNLKNGPGRFWH